VSSSRTRLRAQSSRRSPERRRILLFRRLALHQHPETAEDQLRPSAVRSLCADAVGDLQRHHDMAGDRRRQRATVRRRRTLLIRSLYRQRQALDDSARCAH